MKPILYILLLILLFTSCLKNKELLKPVKYVGTWKMVDASGKDANGNNETYFAIPDSFYLYVELDNKGNAKISSHGAFGVDSVLHGTWSVSNNPQSEFLKVDGQGGWNDDVHGVVYWENDSTIKLDQWNFFPYGISAGLFYYSSATFTRQ